MKKENKSLLNECARLMFECKDKIYYLSNENYKENGILMDLDQILIYDKQHDSISNKGCNMYISGKTIDNYFEDELVVGNVVKVSNEMHYSYRYNLSVNIDNYEQTVVELYKKWCEQNNVKYLMINKIFPDTPDVFREVNIDDKIKEAKTNHNNIYDYSVIRNKITDKEK